MRFKYSGNGFIVSLSLCLTLPHAQGQAVGRGRLSNVNLARLPPRADYHDNGGDTLPRFGRQADCKVLAVTHLIKMRFGLQIPTLTTRHYVWPQFQPGSPLEMVFALHLGERRVLTPALKPSVAARMGSYASLQADVCIYIAVFHMRHCESHVGRAPSCNTGTSELVHKRTCTMDSPGDVRSFISSVVELVRFLPSRSARRGCRSFTPLH